jgi:hypothetical protein
MVGMERGLALALLVVLSGCPKSTPKGDDAPDAAVPAATAAAPAEAEATAAPSRAAEFAGTYTSKPATYYVPDAEDYKRVKPAPDDGSALVGEGALTLSVDEQGRASGAISSGPLAPAVIEGRLEESSLTADIRRKDPKDGGLTGVLRATLSGSDLEGTMALSSATADVVREATLTAKKK